MASSQWMQWECTQRWPKSKIQILRVHIQNLKCSRCRIISFLLTICSSFIATLSHHEGNCCRSLPFRRWIRQNSHSKTSSALLQSSPIRSSLRKRNSEQILDCNAKLLMHKLCKIFINKSIYSVRFHTTMSHNIRVRSKRNLAHI